MESGKKDNELSLGDNVLDTHVGRSRTEAPKSGIYRRMLTLQAVSICAVCAEPLLLYFAS